MSNTNTSIFIDLKLSTSLPCQVYHVQTVFKLHTLHTFFPLLRGWVHTSLGNRVKNGIQSDGKINRKKVKQQHQLYQVKHRTLHGIRNNLHIVTTIFVFISVPVSVDRHYSLVCSIVTVPITCIYVYWNWIKFFWLPFRLLSNEMEWNVSTRHKFVFASCLSHPFHLCCSIHNGKSKSERDKSCTKVLPSQFNVRKTESLMRQHQTNSNIYTHSPNQIYMFTWTKSFLITSNQHK